MRSKQYIRRISSYPLPGNLPKKSRISNENYFVRLRLFTNFGCYGDHIRVDYSKVSSVSFQNIWTNKENEIYYLIYYLGVPLSREPSWMYFKYLGNIIDNMFVDRMVFYDNLQVIQE